MIDKKKDYMHVFGISGVAYEQDQKLFNKLGLEVKINKDGISAKVIEELPDDFVPDEPEPPKDDQAGLTWGEKTQSELTIHERMRVTDENSPHYMTSDELKAELDSKHVSYDKRMGRPKLLAILQHEIV